MIQKPLRHSRTPPLRHKIKKPPKAPPEEKPQIIIGMDHSFPGILRHGQERHECPHTALASYPPFQPKILSYLWVASHPDQCVNWVRSSSAFQRKSKATLKRLAFSMTLSIRHAAELEIIRREMIEFYFPCQE